MEPLTLLCIILAVAFVWTWLAGAFVIKSEIAADPKDTTDWLMLVLWPGLVAATLIAVHYVDWAEPKIQELWDSIVSSFSRR